MGYVAHHAIVVTSSVDDLIQKAHAEATRLEMCPTPIVSNSSNFNGCKSFLVPPDGSKEGWQPSDDGDHARDLFVAYLEAQAYDDGSSSLQWVEVRFGGDEPKLTEIVRCYGGVVRG